MINEVLDQLMYLRLKSAYTFLKELHINDGISQNELKGLYKVLKKEVEAKEENNRLYNVKVAGFPFLRTVDDYDFEFQPSVSKEKIYSIVESNFYEEATNIVFVGNPGTGKTHLAIAIAYAVAIKRNCVYFIKFNKLISILKNAYNEGTFDRKVKQFFKYKLLIIDEKVKISELSRTDFLIRVLTDKPVSVIANGGEILQELKRQGNNLNQAVRNCYFYPDEKEQVLSAAAECKRAYRALLSVIGGD